MNPGPLRVLLVDDQELIRTGFSLILDSQTDVEVVGEASNGQEALAKIEQLLMQNLAPDVVLMDVRMPVMDGIEATTRIVRDYPDTRVLVLTTFDLDEYALAAIEAGAGGFLLKDARAPELIGAVRAVAAGDAVMAQSVTRRLLSKLRDAEQRQGSSLKDRQQVVTHSDLRQLEDLTERESEVFGLIAEGLSNSEIGERLFLSESTVKTHVGRILAKLHLRDRVHAVIFAYEAGLR